MANKWSQEIKPQLEDAFRSDTERYDRMKSRVYSAKAPRPVTPVTSKTSMVRTVDQAMTPKLPTGMSLPSKDEAKPSIDKSVIGKHFVMGAESALEGIKGKEMAIEAVFNEFKISRSEYAILAGFNEALLQSGIGYLPEIHIFCSMDITQSAESFVTKLGKILSPLPGALFTPSSMNRIPVFKNDETVLSWDELVFCRMEGYTDICSAVAPTSIQVVSRPQGSWNNQGITVERLLLRASVGMI